MSDWNAEEARLRRNVQRVMGVLADHLLECAEGDEQALGRAAEALSDEGLSSTDLELAALTLRATAELGGPPAPELAPAKSALRVPSAEEREMVSAEAWGYLLELRQRGSLDSQQFETALERLMSSGMRPAGVELAREVAAQIVLREPGADGTWPGSQGSGH